MTNSSFPPEPSPPPHDSHQPPEPPPPSGASDHIEANSKPFHHGWKWFKEGADLFFSRFTSWLGIVVLYQLIVIISVFVPLIGPFIAFFLIPVFIGGMMIGCERQRNGELFNLDALFAGFRAQRGKLFQLGLVNIAFLLLISLALAFAITPILMDSLNNGAPPESPEQMAELLQNLPMEARQKIALAVLVVMLFVIPLAMTLWLAPALIALRGVAVATALKLSFKGAMKNILPSLLYGLVFLGLIMLSAQTVQLGGIGVILNLLLSVITVGLIFTSTYAAYADIFSAHPAAPKEDAPFEA